VYATVAWNVLTVAVSLPAAVAAGSVALAGFGLDSGVEVAASLVVLAALRGDPAEHQARYLRLIRLAFVAIAVYLVAQAAFVLLRHDEPRPSPVGIVLLVMTVVVMSTPGGAQATRGQAARERCRRGRGESDAHRLC